LLEITKVMLKNFLKILAALAGLALIGFLLSRKVTFWELEAVKQKPKLPPTNHVPDTSPKKTPSKKPASKSEPTVSQQKPGATKQKDDLKLIKGIGASIEKKLNAMGIYTYEQIANFTPEDEQRIGDAIAFPGRIERDDWVKQAKDLNKQGNKSNKG
jgi:predicted flap endonuclease-1-like 5' DNA nuclease